VVIIDVANNLIKKTSKVVPALWAGYFASEMNAHKSLGGLVCSTWYAVDRSNNVHRVPLIQLPA